MYSNAKNNQLMSQKRFPDQAPSCCYRDCEELSKKRRFERDSPPKPHMSPRSPASKCQNSPVHDLDSILLSSIAAAEECHYPDAPSSSMRPFAVIRYTGQSRQGHAPYTPNKTNQDTLIMLEDPLSQSLLLGCFDGHGEHGHLVSQYFKVEMEKRLFAHPLFRDEGDLKGAISALVSEIEAELLANSSIKTDFSGTTMSVAVIKGHHITVANVGDSRVTLAVRRKSKSSTNVVPPEAVAVAVADRVNADDVSVGRDKDQHHNSTLDTNDSCLLPTLKSPSSSGSTILDPGTNTTADADIGIDCATGGRIPITDDDSSSDELLMAESISRDHKPDVPEEHARIIATGGRVFAVEYDDGIKGPQRVWLPNINTPGLAMSRSLCDRVAHLAGVSSSPEFFERTLDPAADCMLIVATDGLWEFVSDQEAVDIAQSASDPSEAVEELIRESSERWLNSEQFIDDTTVCVAFLSGMLTARSVTPDDKTSPAISVDDISSRPLPATVTPCEETTRADLI